MNKPMVVYHRGRHGDIGGRMVRENSLEAFALSVREDAEMVECDVWNDLRITHDPAAITDAPPTLTEVLECINGRCAVNIEVKSPRVAGAVTTIVDRFLRSSRWSPEQFVLSSFHHGAAIALKAALPEICVGAINDGVLEPVYIEWLWKKGIDQVHIEWMNTLMDREAGYTMREACRFFRMPIWAWVVNGHAAFDTATRYGAEAIFTDHPDLFR